MQNKTTSSKVSAALKLSTLLLAGTSFNAFSHAEHDKPRYVSENGVDKGRCEVKASPCKSIAYAAKNSNKGDRILVSSGKYQVKDIETLFYLTSEVVPVVAGYNQQFTKKSTSKNQTFLSGVPVEYAEQLTEAGFQIIVDSKGLPEAAQKELTTKLSAIKTLAEPQSNVSCSNGSASGFPCKNMDLLAHIPLSSFSTNPSAANDIWGFVDLNDQREYAIIGLRNGVSVVDVTDPENPSIVKTLSSQSTTWRDIKVYQQYDQAAQRFKSYAYVTADSASVGLMILDLTGLPNDVTIADIDTTDLSAHNVYMSNVDYSTGTPLTGERPYLHIAGSNRFGGGFNSFDLSNPTRLTQTYAARQGTRARYTHDASSMIITDERKDTQCKNGGETCEVLMDFNEQEFLLWDKTRNSSPEVLSSTSYNNASYVHSGWWSEDQLYVLVHDELDEQNHGLNTTVRIFDISDLTNPSMVSIWTGSTGAIDHNGFVRGNHYYMSTYERGVTVLDISDPHNPFEIGYFDTFPISNNTSFNGAWGVYPYLPSGVILASDINSGLYVLKDNTYAASASGTVGFTANAYDATEGDNLNVVVERSGDITKAVSVQYETHVLSALTNDFTMQKGKLSWTANESGSKTIVIPIADDGDTSEKLEKFMVRLYNPTNGLTLAKNNFAVASIQADPEVPVDSKFQFSQQGAVNVIENGESFTLEVTRQGSDSTAQTITFAQSNASDSDAAKESFDYTLSPSSKQLVWTAGDVEPKTITVTVKDDQQSESTFEKLVLTLSHENADRLGENTNVTINIRDDDSNAAPVIEPLTDISLEGANTVQLVANASDAESDAFTYQWAQTAGSTVAITNDTQSTASINVEDKTEAYTFSVTVTDALGASSTDELTVNITKKPEPVKNTGGSSSNSSNTSSSGSSGSFPPVLLLLAVTALMRRRVR